MQPRGHDGKGRDQSKHRHLTSHVDASSHNSHPGRARLGPRFLHGLVLDGVYRRTGGEPDFQAARAPTRAGLAGLLDNIIARLMNMLTRRGYLVAEQGMSDLADLDADDRLRSLQAASCTHRIAPGPRAGQKVLSLRTMPSRDTECTPALCADAHGFSLNAGARCGAHQREWRIEVVRRPDIPRFEPLPKRWIVERILAWISRTRRLARDFERHARIAAAFVRLAMLRIMLRRLAAHSI